VTADPTSRDDRILACLRQSMSGWSEAISIAHKLHAPEADVNAALTRMMGTGKVQRRILTGARRAVEWCVL
jgi:hypothetical protein